MTGRPVPITIRGVSYPSLSAASKALGVTATSIWEARKRGTLENVGRAPLKTVALIHQLSIATPEDFPRLVEEAKKWIELRDRNAKEKIHRRFRKASE